MEHTANQSTHDKARIDVLPVAIGPVWLGLDASRAVEIMGHTPWVPVPSASALVPGVLAWRGRPVAVLDLGAFLPDVPRLEPGASRDRVVVVETPQGMVALAVDAVRGVTPVAPGAVRDAQLTRGAAKEVTVGTTCMPWVDLTQVVEAQVLRREGT